MLLQQLNNDCISEIVSHLNFKYWDHFKNTSKIYSSLINEQKYNIKMCIDDTWGNITISGKKYNHHYFGEVIKPKKYTKKHNMDIFVMDMVYIQNKQVNIQRLYIEVIL